MTHEYLRAPLTADGLSHLVGGTAPLAALAVTPASPSTNSELLEALAADPDAWPHMSALVTDHQVAGRGRAGRGWDTPRGAALTASFVVRPEIEPGRWGLVPLAVGLACVRALRAGGLDAMLKWPNDVVVPTDGDDVPGWGGLRKVAGILCERHDSVVVAGIGINVSQSPDELPVPHAASLRMMGSEQLDRGALLGALAQQLAEVMADLAHDADGLVADVEAVTFTLGQDVVVERPGELPLSGTALSLGSDGALIVRTSRGEDVAVHAGDVRLRAAP